MTDHPLDPKLIDAISEYKTWYLDPSDTQRLLIKPLRTKATCDLFGNSELMIDFRGDNCIPNRWIRFWTKVFFNSKWTVMEDNS